MPEKDERENETAPTDDEIKLGRIEIVGLFAAVLLLLVLLWMLVEPPARLL